MSSGGTLKDDRVAVANALATALFHETLDCLADHVALLAADGEVLAVNKAWNDFARANGYADGATGLGTNYAEVCDAARGPDSSEASAAATGIRAVLAGARPDFSLDYPCHSPTEPRWFRMTVRRTLHPGPVAAIVIHTDRTDERLAYDLVAAERDSANAVRHARRTEEALFRALTEQSLEFVSILHGDGRFRYVSPSVRRTLGYEPNELLGTRPVDLVHPDDRSLMIDTFLGLSEGGHGTAASMAVRLRHRDGSWRYFEGGGQNLLDDPSVLGITSNARDVTERHAAEVELHFRAHLLDAVEQAVIAFDLGGRVTYWNDFAARLYGWSSAEACGKDIAVILPGGSPHALHEAIMETLLRGDSWSGELEVAARDGRRIDVHMTDSPIYGPDGALIGIVGVSFDVAERRALEEQLRQSQRLEAVGQLAGGIAHDFNNLLTVIGAHSTYLLESFDASDQRRLDARAIQEAADGAATLTRQLLAYGRKQVLSPTMENLNTIITNTHRMFGRLLDDATDVRLILADDIGPVLVDVSQVEQVLINLVLNARDAMRTGGVLTIGTRTLSLARASVMYDRVPPGHYVVLSVADTGVGMDVPTQAHVFEPFFTTKEFSKGTGLGLSTVYGIVKQSGGYVFVTSAPAQGATFEILFPRAVLELASSPAAAVPALRPAETVLLVEDDAAVRQIAKRVLMREGYHVLVASSGAEAVALSGNYEDVIHVVVSDAVMPGMTGATLLNHIVSSRPRCKAVLMSGYTDDDIARRGIAALNVTFIQKPFTPADFARLIRETLDSA